MKKKGIIILLAVLAVIGLIIGGVAGSYNGLVEQREYVDNAQATISTQLQRRADRLRAIPIMKKAPIPPLQKHARQYRALKPQKSRPKPQISLTALFRFG